MFPTLTDETAQQAADHLSQHDPTLAAVIAQVGLCPRRPHQDYYRALVSSIVGQQLSVKAAASIFERFLQLFGGDFPEPAAILEKTAEELRSAGLSGAKARYIQDLAQKVIDGGVAFEQLDKLDNEAIIAELTTVTGIGVWTVHMFLMFCMGRLDVLPTGDLGIRNGVARLYSLSAPASAAQVETVAKENSWHPYESVASWYVWQSLDNEPS